MSGCGSLDASSNGGISVSFLVNHEAIKEYNAATNGNISYGAFAVTQATAEGKEIIDQQGNGIKGVASVDFSKRAYDIFVIKVAGFETDDHRNTMLALGGYVIDNGKVSYLQVGSPAENQSYVYTSYNQQIG